MCFSKWKLCDLQEETFHSLPNAIGYFTKKAGDQFDLRLLKNPLYFLIL